jgi:hypothetical protein
VESIINIALLILSILTLFISLITLRWVIKSVTGEIYQSPQFESLHFFTPSIKLYQVKHLPQTDKTTHLGKEITIKSGVKVELPIITASKRIQRVRRVSLGFEGNAAEIPEIIGMHSLVKKWIDKLPREEYIDIWGFRYVEYSNPRTLPKDEDFILNPIVRGKKLGKYTLRITIYTEESIKPLTERLIVEIIE